MTISIVFTSFAFDVKVSQEGESMVIEYLLDSPQFTYDSKSNQVTQISMTGFNNSILPEKPSTPFRIEKFLIPEGLKIKDVSVETIMDSISAKLLSTPYPSIDKSEILSQPSTITPYEGYWPNSLAHITNIGVYRNNKIAKLHISPAQYDMSNNMLTYSKSLTIKVSFEPESTYFRAKSNSDQNISNGFLDDILTISNPFVQNYEIDPMAIILPVRKYAPTCLFIAPKEFESEANRYAEWKRRLGYNIKVITKDESFLQNPYNTRQIIVDLYNEGENIEYVLLMGGGDIITPFLGKWYNKAPVKDANGKVLGYYPYYTDYYFGCMDNDEDEMDEYSDIIIGRFPAYTVSQLTNMIDKSITYEKNPPQNLFYFNNATFVSEFDSEVSLKNGVQVNREKSYFIYSSEKIQELLDEYVYGYEPNIQKIYYANSPDNSYNWVYNNLADLPESINPSNYNWNKKPSDIVAAMKQGTSQLFFRGHGDVGQWSYMGFTDNALGFTPNKDQYPATFAITCLSGTFYGPLNKPEGTLSLGEKMLARYNSGCASFIGANSESWNYYNDYLFAGLFEAMYPSSMNNFALPKKLYPGTSNKFIPCLISKPGKTEIGRILYYATDKMMEISDGDEDAYANMNRETFHCLGDPTLRIYTSTPTSKRPELIKENGEIHLYDNTRILVAVHNTTNNVYLPQKENGYWNISSLINSYYLSLVNDTEKIAPLNPPVMLDSYIARLLANEEGVVITDINKTGDSYMVKISSEELGYCISTYNQFGNKTSITSIENGEAIIPTVDSFTIITLEKDNNIIDRKIVH